MSLVERRPDSSKDFWLKQGGVERKRNELKVILREGTRVIRENKKEREKKEERRKEK